jgi:hypothetical protein
LEGLGKHQYSDHLVHRYKVTVDPRKHQVMVIRLVYLVVQNFCYSLSFYSSFTSIHYSTRGFHCDNAIQAVYLEQVQNFLREIMFCLQLSQILTASGVPGAASSVWTLPV